MTRNLAFEWRRAVSLRSTWGFPLIGLLIGGLITAAVMASPGATGQQPTMGDVLTNAASPFSLVFITTICAQAFGHDYRDGTMRLVLSEYPVRSRAFWAKLIVPAALVAVAVAVMALLMRLLAPMIGDVEAGGSTGSLVLLAARQVGLAVWWGLVVAAITALLRNLAAGIVVAIMLAGIVELLLVGLLGSRIPWLADVLPFMNGQQWASTGSVHAGLVMLAWVVGLVCSAWALFVKRDA
ncbi:MAG: hypothetical protein ACOYEV_06855 [Candidatus Nanopelagicales bacterium]